MRREDFEQRFVRRIYSAVFHRNADAEADVKTVTQVNVAQLASFDGETVGFRNAETRLHEIATKTVT